MRTGGGQHCRQLYHTMHFCCEYDTNVWDGCTWVMAGGDGTQKYGDTDIGYAKSPDDCAEMVREKCPDACMNSPDHVDADCSARPLTAVCRKSPEFTATIVD